MAGKVELGKEATIPEINDLAANLLVSQPKFAGVKRHKFDVPGTIIDGMMERYKLNGYNPNGLVKGELYLSFFPSERIPVSDIGWKDDGSIEINNYKLFTCPRSLQAILYLMHEDDGHELIRGNRFFRFSVTEGAKRVDARYNCMVFKTEGSKTDVERDEKNDPQDLKILKDLLENATKSVPKFVSEPLGRHQRFPMLNVAIRTASLLWPVISKYR